MKFQFDFLQDLCPVYYKGPEIAAKAVASLYNEDHRENINILDIAAGTGFVAEQVKLFILSLNVFFGGEGGGVVVIIYNTIVLCIHMVTLFFEGGGGFWSSSVIQCIYVFTFDCIVFSTRTK